MQKFKVTREALRKATAYSFSTYDTPAFYELEGELLEGGGTVEKCKGNCPNVCKQHMGEFTFCSNLGCLCHKVEKCCKNIGGNGHWNDCPVYGHGVEKKDNSWSGPDPVICCNLCDAKLKSGLIHCTNFRCECHNKKEECTCPSCQAGHKNGHNAMRNFNREKPKELNFAFDVSQEIRLLQMKLNEVIRYLASKENK